MQTVIIDILNDKAVKLLQDLEQLQLIRMRKVSRQSEQSVDWSATYKGAMTKQQIADIDNQLNELRGEWD